MRIGTYYYPEQWPAEQWERDFDNIAAMGLQIVHMAEFAWFALEPRPGEFRFEWLDRCLELAEERSLEVILCTPTAAPPIWLTQEHPEILPVDAHGTRGRFGGRRHYSPTSPAMKEAAARIVNALGKHFGQHPSVIGWQIDNEYSSVAFDQSDETHRQFRDWLKHRYDSIDALNKAWGNQFWNQYYTDFSQILMPADRNPHYANPHHCLDASRFWSWAFAQFNKVQADILKKYIGDRFITTNFMPFHMDADPGDMRGELSLYAWDSYPITGWVKNPRDDHYRIADPAAIGFVHDQMASYTGRWALMELQPGHTNWSGVPVLPYPGAIRLWIWTALAHGAEFVTTYRYRQPRFGIELFHDGLVEPDGTTPSPGGREFMQAIDEVKRIDKAKWNAGASGSIAPIDPARTVGLLFDHEQLWWYATLPQARRWNQPLWLQTWYAAATRLGLEVRILHPRRDWPAELKMVIVPGLQMVDDDDIARMGRFVDGGGHLVLTCRTGLMDRNGQLWEGQWAKPILDLVGGEIEAYDSLPEDCFGQVELDGKTHPWGVWGDLLYAAEDMKVLAKYADQFYAGAAAVTQCKRKGGGVTTYCGVFAEGSFVEALMEKLAAQAKLATTPLPTRVQLLRRGPYRIVLNYQDKPYTAPSPKGAKFVLGSKTVEPAGVAIWEE